MLPGLRILASRIRGFFAGHRLDEDFQRELASHLEMLTEENIRRGFPPDQARRQARLRLGGAAQLRETQHDLRGLPWLDTLLQDLRFGLRMLAKVPGLTFTLAITLALGIGVNAAIFSIVNSFLLRPLPVPHAEQVTMLASHQPGAPPGMFYFSYPDLADFRNQAASSFSDIFAYKLFLVGLSTGGRGEQLTVGYVTGNYFSALGLHPALGRLFLPGEGERPGDSPFLILGYSYWQTRFGRNPDIIGKQVRVDGNPATIIGVAPKGFSGTQSLVRMDAYMPLSMLAQDLILKDLFASREMRTLSAMATLRPGVSLAQAQSSTNVIAARLASQYNDADKGITVRVVPERLARPSPDAGRMLPVVAGMFLVLAGIVLLLVCMNVANILIARAVVRQREMAIRAALGAGRARLVRQIFTEAIILAVLGGTVGAVIADWASDSVVSILPKSSVPLHIDFHFDWRVFFFALGATLFAGILVGLWPALRAARTDPNITLREGGRSDSAGTSRHRVTSSLVVAQVAGSLMLLIVAALFVRSLERAERTYLGFDPNHVVYVIVDPHEIGYDKVHTNQLYRELEDRLRALPGAKSVAMSYSVPMGIMSDARPVNIEGRPVPEGQQPPLVMFNAVDPPYFETLRTPLLRGRSFTDSDNETSPQVAIVNEKMAQEFWPGERAIGKRFSVTGATGPFVEIVGITGNGTYGFMGESNQPFFYLPLAQSFISVRALQIRSSTLPQSLLLDMQREIRNVAPDLPILDAETMDESLKGLNGYFIFRFGATMAGMMGCIGLALAMVGVYGVVSFAGAQRTHEIGIRMALGAQRRDILRLLLRQGLIVVMAGIALGLIGGWGLIRAMGRFAAGPSSAGFWTFAGAALVMACVALLASYIPARRAMRVDPMVALRHE